ncbi:MAG TPA: DUF4339 domain-containing protein [Bacillota bacterium]|jgi:hypothetical protein|nr:DUF4339 domain-containing protein [Bacillota bacterium]HQI16657.1 DUF4339 domain-containing protein [Bacillota bacterium]HQJ38105.1 DUF4339 domain-containing protein [Bacillota bacterium]HRU41095.1 DUF4339 domain-containing protein [Candidatus Diapherotrites archaeon]
MYKIDRESMGDVKKYIWYYRKDNNEHGPFTYEDIVEMVRTGVIGPEDYVLKFGNRKFIKVSEVQGLSEIQGPLEVPEPVEMQEPSEDIEAIEQHEEMKEAAPETKKEKTKEEYHIAYDSRGKYIQGKHKKEPFGQKLPVIIACFVGLCFIVVLWILLF